MSNKSKLVIRWNPKKYLINSKEDRNWGKMEQRTYGIENIKIVEVK